MSERPETGAPETSSEAAASWPAADLTVKTRARRVKLSRQRAVNSGVAELGVWLSAAVASWSDELDKLTAAALDGAPEVSAAAAAILTDAPTALNRQQVGGLPLGSDGPLPMVLAGDGDRRDLLVSVPGAPRSAGDLQAAVDGVRFSASVDGAKAYLVHGSFAPLALPVLGDGDVMPSLSLGAAAGVRDSDGMPSDFGAGIVLDAGDPVALTAGSAVVGAVRLTVSTDGAGG